MNLSACLTEYLVSIKTKYPAAWQSWYLHDWSTDPFSLGAYSYIGVGGVDAPSELAKPVENTLFFAGEATDSNGQSGTVDAAIVSGKRAAREILESL